MKGAAVAAHIREVLTERIHACHQRGIHPKIAVLRVGERPDDLAYEKRVVGNCGKVGLECEVRVLDGQISQTDFEREFDAVNSDGDIHGILLFRPLPEQLDEEAICRRIDPKKDIDCMNPVNLNKVFTGEKDRFAPCTPEAVVEILKYYQVPIQGANAVIINRSMVLGKPLAMLLLEENATVTLCHSKTVETERLTREADIVVTGIGRAEYFDDRYFSEKNTVIDVGINFIEGKMAGDVRFEQAEPIVRAITPVPGGVGAVTSMILLKHAVDAAWRRENE